jgi:hypothetical protein
VSSAQFQSFPKTSESGSWPKILASVSRSNVIKPGKSGQNGANVCTIGLVITTTMRSSGVRRGPRRVCFIASMVEAKPFKARKSSKSRIIISTSHGSFGIHIVNFLLAFGNGHFTVRKSIVVTMVFIEDGIVDPSFG